MTDAEACRYLNRYGAIRVAHGFYDVMHSPTNGRHGAEHEYLLAYEGRRTMLKLYHGSTTGIRIYYSVTKNIEIIGEAVAVRDFFCTFARRYAEGVMIGMRGYSPFNLSTFKQDLVYERD